MELFFRNPLILLSCILVMAAANADEKTDKSFAVYPVGSVEKEDGRTLLVINRDIQPALLGLDGFSHVWVFWWFDRNDTPEKRAILQVHPRADKKIP